MDAFRQKKILLVLLLGISLGAMLLLAGGLPNLRFQPGKSLHLFDWLLARITSVGTNDQFEFGPRVETSSGIFTQLGDRMLRTLIVVFWLMLIFSILFAIVSPKFRRELVRMFAVFLPIMILLPYIAERLAMQQRLSEEELSGGYALGDGPLIETPSFIQQPPDWLFILVDFLLLGLLFAVIFLIWQRFRPKSDAQAVVVKQVKRALSDLDAGLGLKDVVIACYSRMCQGLQKSQRIRRKKDMTPREFKEYLATAGIASTHIEQLTRLFEDVRYGARSSDTNVELEAKKCLQAILQAYGE